ncbi:MAG: hypothetical protein AB1758_04875 [Candidatus Eremiobacterota bacterium]
MSDPAARFYGELAQLAESAVASLVVQPPKRAGRGQVLKERLRTRLADRQGILEQLQTGQIGAEQALTFLVEEQVASGTDSGAYGQYLSQLSQHLKRIASKLPGTPQETGEPPSTNDASGGPDE